MKSFAIRVCLVALLVSGAITGCGDSSLGGAYFISNSSNDHVYVWKRQRGEARIVIDEQVVDWKRAGRYAFVLRMYAESPDCYDKEGRATIITRYSTKEEYWIADLDRSVEYGPLSASEYAARLIQLKVPPVTLSVPLNFRANTDAFRREVVRCVRLG